MPYVTCGQCGLATYAVAHYSTVELCPRCGGKLRPRPAEGAALSRELAPDPTAPAVARAALRGLGTRVAGFDMELVQLLATEVIGNAVRHAALDGGAPISMRVFLAADRMRVEIHDHGPGFVPSVTEPDPSSANGRGLFLVDSLASAWGMNCDKGTTVWFESVPAPR